MNTATKERPILFSGEMVRAILAGRKTQTRRVIKSQPNFDWSPSVGFYCPVVVDRHGHDELGPELYGAADEDDGRKSPYGKPGERLWVRETWTQPEPGPVRVGNEVVYREDYADDPCGYDGEKSPEGKFRTWKPSIHMPRWASRLTLEITDIRVERLKEISEADAIAEGVEPTRPLYGDCGGHTHEGHKESFRILWDTLNGKRDFGWDQNPWVFVIEFKKLEET